MLLDYLMLPVIFLIGGVVSYQDFKFGKIRNKWILRGLAWGLIVYLVLFLSLFLAAYLPFFSKITSFISYAYIYKALLNAFIALALGYVLWYFELWSAGDAKLFFVFSLLLPLTHYWRSYLFYFPSLALLINVFIPALLFLFVQNLILIFKDATRYPLSLGKIKFLFREIKIYFESNYQTLLKSFVSFSLIFLVFQMLRQAVANHTNQNQWWSSGLLLIILGASGYIRRALGMNYVLGSLSLIFIVYVAIQNQGILGKMALAARSSLVYFAAFPLIALIFSYSQKKDHMQRMPFAVWLFLGVIITIILKGSIISFLFSPYSFFR
ncbi:MAG: hypothetical protein QMD77_00705 [Patescibacteria group bacterium]|nr:hypothetical protein [Patescibacteria group bacterium]